MRLPSMPGECWSVGLGLAASLQTVCAASVPRAVDQLLTTDPTRGADCTASGAEPRDWRPCSDGEVTTRLLLAMVMFVGSIGMRTGSLLLRMTASQPQEDRLL